jgi:uncharacterized protein
VIYLDSSALMKLIRMENETAALCDWLGERSEQPVVSSELGRVEVLRAARRVGGRTLTEARAVVGDIDLIPLDRTVQDLASDIGHPLLRTLDALHLASAVLFSDELTASLPTTNGSPAWLRPPAWSSSHRSEGPTPREAANVGCPTAHPPPIWLAPPPTTARDGFRAEVATTATTRGYFVCQYGPQRLWDRVEHAATFWNQ